MIFLANAELTNFSGKLLLSLPLFYVYIYLLATNNIEQYVILIVVKFFVLVYFLPECICKAKKKS